MISAHYGGDFMSMPTAVRLPEPQNQPRCTCGFISEIVGEVDAHIGYMKQSGDDDHEEA